MPPHVYNYSGLNQDDKIKATLTPDDIKYFNLPERR